MCDLFMVNIIYLNLFGQVESEGDIKKVGGPDFSKMVTQVCASFNLTLGVNYILFFLSSPCS